MSADITRGYDSFFGPPSEPISIRKFLDDTASLVCPTPSDVLNHAGWQTLSEDEQAAVEAECSSGIAELKAAVENVWDNPMLSAHLHRTHAAAVNAIHSQAGGTPSNGRKRKHLPDPEAAEAQPDVRAFQEKLDAIPLQCWRLNQDAAFFLRASKHSDLNALQHAKKSGRGALIWDEPPPQRPRADVLVTLTHVVLASQTLADFVRAIPCDSSDMPNEVVDGHGNVVGYEGEGQRRETTACASRGCLLLIEGVVYGDGRPGDDYADKLLLHLQSVPEEKRPQITKSPTPLAQTPFASLTLRIHQPYWMLHQGSCEHFIVVDQIRLAHSLDPPFGYPLTVYVTPVLGDVCKACAKVPAVLTVVEDIRLGESPCLLCGPCWQNMGLPRGEDAARVMMVPLVGHGRIWEDSGDT